MLTITEALAEIATIEKRLAKKSQDMLPYVCRLEIVRDPLERNGGSAKHIAEEKQSFYDLQKRRVALRAAIAKANAETLLPGLEELTVADWLVWKRECYKPQQMMLNALLGQVRSVRSEIQQNRNRQDTVAKSMDDVVVNLDEQKLMEEIESLEELFGKLDGLLSLKNATTFIEV